MIYGLLIFDRSGVSVFKRFYGNLNLDRELLVDFVGEFVTFIQNLDRSERIECLNLENMKFVYSIHKEIVSVLCSDQREDEMYLMDKLIKIQDEFTKLLSSVPKDQTVEEPLVEETPPEDAKGEELSEEAVDEEAAEWESVEEEKSQIEEDPFECFGQIVDEILFPFLKMVILGEGGVGKTSVLKLIMGEEPDSCYVPTVGVDVKEFDFELRDMKLVFWDFSGQPRFRKLWKPFLEGTDIVILVTDSTIENLVETRTIYQLIRAEKPDAQVILIANKQDLPGAVPPETIGKYLGLEAHGLVAVDPSYREKLLEILKEAIVKLMETKYQQPQISNIKT